MNIAEWGRKFWKDNMEGPVEGTTSFFRSPCQQRNVLRVMLDEHGKAVWSWAEFRAPLTKAQYDSEQEGLNRWWQALKEGDRSVLLIVGPPGWDVEVMPSSRHCCCCHAQEVHKPSE